MTPTPPPAWPRRKLLVTLYIGYLLVVGGYLIYGTFTQTGLGGWVLAQELEWFGSASQKLTILPPLVVAMVLPLLLLAPLLPKGERAQPAGWPAGPAAAGPADFLAPTPAARAGAPAGGAAHLLLRAAPGRA